MILNQSPPDGTGRNPNSNLPDLPLGLGMALGQDVAAMTYFGKLPESDKLKIINYIKSSDTAQDAHERISKTVKNLSDGIPPQY